MTMELRDELRQREREQARARRRRERFAADVRALADLPEGRRFFRWLIEQGNIFAEDFQPGPLGAYRAGTKAMSVRLWRLLREHLSRAAFVAVTLEAGDAAPEDENGGGPDASETGGARDGEYL